MFVWSNLYCKSLQLSWSCRKHNQLPPRSLSCALEQSSLSFLIIHSKKLLFGVYSQCHWQIKATSEPQIEIRQLRPISVIRSPSNPRLNREHGASKHADNWLNYQMFLSTPLIIVIICYQYWHALSSYAIAASSISSGNYIRMKLACSLLCWTLVQSRSLSTLRSYIPQWA